MRGPKVAIAVILHLRSLVAGVSGVQSCRAAARRFLALPTLPDPPGLPDLVAGPGRLQISGLGLKGALHDVTLHAEPGQTVAIVGGNGAGKSTLVGLAARLFD